MDKFNFDPELIRNKIVHCFWWIQLAALGAILAASGALGLVYELVWTRLLSLILGSTSLGVAAALAGFMGGLAGGSLLAGIYSTGRAGGGVGSVYAINALGAIGGSLAATFLLIPLLGTRISLVAVSSLNLAVGAWALWRSAAEGVWKRLWPVAVPLAVLMLVSGYSRWNPRYLTAGSLIKVIQEEIKESEGAGQKPNAGLDI